MIHGEVDRERRVHHRDAGHAQPRPQASRFRPLILLVEDDPNDQEIYGKGLWYNGYDLIAAEDGQRAVELARKHRPDLVMIDLVLPRLNGIEACRRLKADPATAGIPVIALTACSEGEFGLLARNAGCGRYLEKPIGPLDVLKAVEETIGRPPPAGEDPGPGALA
jgi:CheY-like chemotaxis protein